MTWELAAILVLAATLLGGFAWYERSRPPSQIVALVGALRLTAKVSLASASRSPLTSTVIVPVVWPAGIVSVPEVAS